MVISNHFPPKDLVHHSIETTIFIGCLLKQPFLSCKGLVHHPIETTIKTWLLGISERSAVFQQFKW